MNPRIQDVKVICTAPEGINLVVVKVETTEPGLYGLGCATLAYRWRAVKHLIETYLKPLVVGREVNNITELWQLMHQKYRHVDGADVDEICENIEKYRSIGVKYIRCQCGGYGGSDYGKAPSWAAKGALDGVYLDSKKYMRDTLHLFEQIRIKEGEEIELVHDVHERIHPTEAVRFVKEMEPYKLFFMEDVVPLEHIDWLSRIKQTSVTPLSQGELFNNPAEYKKLIESRAIDYIRVHLSEVGGITPSKKLQQFAAEYGVRICWHGPGDMSPLAHAANIHIDLAAENLGLQEWSGIEPPNFVIQKLAGPRGALLEVFPGLPEYGNDGFVYANDKPGLGVDLNEKEAAKYPCSDEITTWTQTRNADGSLQTP